MFSSNRYYRGLSTQFKTLDSLLYVSEDITEQKKIIKLYKECLDKHDYLYIYSDDSKVYNLGKLESAILLEATKNFSYLTAILTNYYSKKQPTT